MPLASRRSSSNRSKFPPFTEQMNTRVLNLITTPPEVLPPSCPHPRIHLFHPGRVYLGFWSPLSKQATSRSGFLVGAWTHPEQVVLLYFPINIIIVVIERLGVETNQLTIQPMRNGEEFRQTPRTRKLASERKNTRPSSFIFTILYFYSSERFFFSSLISWSARPSSLSSESSSPHHQQDLNERSKTRKKDHFSCNFFPRRRKSPAEWCLLHTLPLPHSASVYWNTSGTPT